MPTDERPIRDVLREVEEAFAEGDNMLCETVEFLGEKHLERLARELRALAPLLRQAARELERHMHPNDRVFLDTLDTKADELEAK